MFGAHPMLRTGGAVSYSVPYSLRFRYSNNASLSRTGVVSPTNDKVYTWSAWVKLAFMGSDPDYGTLFSGYTASSDTGRLTIRIYQNTLQVGGWATNWRITSALFRDPSAWYHIVIAFDTTNATAADRIKIYVNGTQITSFSTSNNPALNATTGLNNASTAQRLGLDAPAASSYHYDGYMAEVNFIDGQALTPSSFGQTDSATGAWVPKKYSGTYGTNGFYLKFADASAATAAAIGKDSSGNGNNWTPSGISVTSGTTFDQMLDTPTLNYAVMNPLDLSGTAATFQWANLQVTRSGASQAQAYCSIQMSSGKWYCEMTAGADVASLSPGIIVGTANAAANRYLGQDSFTYGYDPDGRKVNSGTYTAYGNTWTAGDIIGIILDADNGKLYFSKNGTVQNSGDPVAGTNAAFTGLTGPYRFSASLENGGIGDFNFGQRAFSYTPPSGFKALNTANLPTPSIKKSSLYMDATLRTGTGATASVSSLGFQPDWVWIKSRSNATAHNLFNSVRGATKGIQTTGPNAEYTDANSLTAFNANGYSLGTDASSRGVNIITNTYVDWAWKESTTAGLDILSWTGNGAGPRTINHALGVTPEFMMLRGTDARVWACWFNSMTSAAYYLDLGSVAVETLDTTIFDSTAPTSTTFRVGSYNNVNAVAYVGYFFSSIAGFSQIGSYTGNASTDGPFVWCGFRPKFVMVKAVDIATGWFMANPSNSANEVIVRVFSDSALGEASNVYGLDLLSNGFKVRAPTGYSLNNSGNKYAFIAFAENPFKYARAR
jgi:hypothetical protein